VYSSLGWHCNNGDPASIFQAVVVLPLSWHFDFLDSHNLPVLQPSTIGNIFGRN